MKKYVLGLSVVFAAELFGLQLEPWQVKARRTSCNRR